MTDVPPTVDWPCCAHCDHDPGLRHTGPCIDCKFGVIDFDRQ